VDDSKLHASPGLTAGNETVTYSAAPVAARGSIAFSGFNNNLLLTANTPGTDLNNVQIIVEDGGSILNNAFVIYDDVAKTLRIQIDNAGLTTVQKVITKINADGHFTAAYDASNPADGGFLATATIPASDVGVVTGNTSNSVILAEGYQMKPGESLIAPTSVITAGDYFKAMHIKLLRGRFFDQRDAPDAPKTIIVDDRLAKKFWGDTDPIGRRLYKPDDPKDIQKITPKTEFFTVVGVIKEVRVVEPGAEFTPVGAYYFPWEQTPNRGPTFIVRSSSPTILS